MTLIFKIVLEVDYRRSTDGFLILRFDEIFKQIQVDAVAFNCLRADFIDVLPVIEKVIKVP